MVTVLLFVITIGKTAMNIGILRLLRLPRTQSFLVGVVLSQLGEFAFLLATVGYQSGIIDDHGQKLIVAMTVLSLGFSPIWLASARRIKEHVDSKALSFTKLLIMAFGPEFSWVQHRLRRKQAKLNEIIVDDEDG
jgi:CPA2 family monovalent cation:H+ antiporter-2